MIVSTCHSWSFAYFSTTWQIRCEGWVEAVRLRWWWWVVAEVEVKVVVAVAARHLRQLVLELDVARDQVGEQLLDQDLNVRLVDERVDELEGTLADRRVGVLQAVDDRVAVALHRLRVGGDDLVQRVQRDVPDVVVAVDQEAAEDVDREHAEAALDLDRHDRQHALVQDRIPSVLRRLGVRRHLWGRGGARRGEARGSSARGAGRRRRRAGGGGVVQGTCARMSFI